MTGLRRKDIIGRRVKAIFGRGTTEDGMNIEDAWVALDSGVAFRLPAFPDEKLKVAVIPEGAVELNDRVLKPVIGAVITALLRPARDDDFVPGSVRLGLSTGKWLCHEFAVPEGCVPGVFVLDRAECENLVDFWIDRVSKLGEGPDRKK